MNEVNVDEIAELATKNKVANNGFFLKKKKNQEKEKKERGNFE